MKIIDALGQPCPIPVIETRKALAQEGEVLIKVDNPVAVQNLEKMATGFGYVFSYEKKTRNLFEVAISKKGKSSPESACTLMPESYGLSETVVLISSDAMGAGSDELGKVLIKGFIYSLTELSKPPRTVIFLNSGARLTSMGANTIDDIKMLEENGTEILTCGTCINYYGLNDKLAVGAVTDMYAITERLAAAGNVINI